MNIATEIAWFCAECGSLVDDIHEGGCPDCDEYTDQEVQP
jgi:rubrerythrin